MANRDKRESPRLSFRPFSFFVACLLITSAVAIAYIVGVMSGRASADREHSRLVLENTIRQPTTQSMESVQKNGVLMAEELEYARALRSDVMRTSKSQVPIKKIVEVKETTPKNTATSGSANTGENSSMPTGQETQASVVIASNTERLKTPEPATLYDYVFQVAAMRSEDAVDALRQRLEGRGLRTKMQREKKMYLVLVMLRGDEGRASEVLQILDDLHLGKPITKSRKPVIQ